MNNKVECRIGQVERISSLM
jgi:hypothetical protein